MLSQSERKCPIRISGTTWPFLPETIESTGSNIPGRAFSLSVSKAVKIALGRLHPSHRPACRVGTFAHGMPADVVRQQTGDLSAQRLGVAERNENAAAVAEQLLGVPIGCRHDCLS